MRRIIVLGLVIFAFSTVNHPANAGWKEFWHKVRIDFNRNNAWPEPFLSADRAIAQAPWAIQTHNGWKIETTLADYHFDHETQQLSRSGELKLQWILKEAPPQRRTVYVLRGATDETTSIRVDAVQQAIAGILPKGSLPEVVQTDIAPRGALAEYVHETNTRAAASRPNPALPASTGE